MDRGSRPSPHVPLLSPLLCVAQEPFLPAQPSPSWHLLTSALLQVLAAEKEDHNLPKEMEGGALPIFCFSHAPTLVEALPGYKKGFETKTQMATSYELQFHL